MNDDEWDVIAALDLGAVFSSLASIQILVLALIYTNKSSRILCFFEWWPLTVDNMKTLYFDWWWRTGYFLVVTLSSAIACTFFVTTQKYLGLQAKMFYLKFMFVG